MIRGARIALGIAALVALWPATAAAAPSSARSAASSRNNTASRARLTPSARRIATSRRRESAQALAGARTVFERYGATVDQYPGDALMAVFGVPLLHEDDALRATRAALDARLGVASLSDQLTRELGIELQVRIGLAAGEVVASATESRQRFVAGDAVGIAARLQHAAEP